MKYPAAGMAAIVFAMLAFASDGQAKDIPYLESVTMKVGQSVVLKGVRNHNCGLIAPRWAGVRRKLPASRLGTFSDGGTGSLNSKSCGRRVAARGVKFTAKKKGTERLTIYEDKVQITVK